MNILTKIIKFTILLELGKKFLRAIRPPRAYSWETFLGLGLFSWFMSSFATSLVQDITRIGGWLFFIAAIDWAARKYYLFLRPWLTGALICIFIFHISLDEVPQEAVVIWPPISALVAGLPKFFDRQLYLRLPPVKERQNLVVLLSSQIILSCWLQFAILTQNWLTEYPSLLAEDFDRSSFVRRLDWGKKIEPQGVNILNEFTEEVKQQLKEKSWSSVNNWFKGQEWQLQMQRISEEAKRSVFLSENQFLEGQESPESSWWQISYSSQPVVSGYKIKLLALWNGPRSSEQQYYVEKTCDVIPASFYEANKDAVEFHCEPVKIQGWS